MNTEFRMMPEQASTIAGEVDGLYLFLIIVSAFFIVGIAFAIIYFAIKYRRGSKANRVQGTGHFFLLEVTWIVIPFLLTLVMFYQGARIYFRQSRPPSNAMEIECVGRQWMWKFQHPEGNSEINDLHVPLGQPVKIRLISEDVIHSLYIPAFRIKQDVLPGRYTTIWFEATKEGQYHLFCAEYCGAKHSEMRGTVTVMKPKDYQAWLSGNMFQETSSRATLLEELRCNNCHFPAEGVPRGPPLENLLGSQVRLQDGSTVVADETFIRESILKPAATIVAGYPPIMPSYEGQLGEADILQLIREIKALSRSETVGSSTTDQKEKDVPPP